jgi:hypothetical protein
MTGLPLTPNPSDKCPALGHVHPDILFLKNVTGAFVAPGILNPRESIAYFPFAHDGLPHGVALGLKLWNGRVREQ